MNEHEEGPVPGLSRLRQDSAPARDLWPGIRPRLRPRRRYAPWIGMALAASLVMGLALNVRQQGMNPDAAVDLALARAGVPHQRSDHRALLKANLKIVDDAQNQLLHALKDQPDSRSLKRLLQSTHQQRRQLRQLLLKPA